MRRPPCHALEGPVVDAAIDDTAVAGTTVAGTTVAGTTVAGTTVGRSAAEGDVVGHGATGVSGVAEGPAASDTGVEVTAVEDTLCDARGSFPV